MKVVKESLNETWDKVKSAISAPFKERTNENVLSVTQKTLTDGKKILRIIDVLKANKNPKHLENFIKAKKEYDMGNKLPFAYFLCFILDNWSDFKNSHIIYYQVTSDGVKLAGETDWPL